MFDVKPTRADGFLDLEKIKKSKRIIALEKKEFLSHRNAVSDKPETVSRRTKNLRLADVVKPKEKSHESSLFQAEKSVRRNFDEGRILESRFKPSKSSHFFETQAEILKPQIENIPEKIHIAGIETPARKKKQRKPSLKSRLRLLRKKFVPGANIFEKNIHPIPRFGFGISFAAVLLFFSLFVPALLYFQKAINLKSSIVSSGEKAFGQLAEAKDSLSSSDFEKAAVDFSNSYEILSDANREIGSLGGNFSYILRFIPGASRLASANYVISAGEHFSLAGKSLAESAKSLESLENPLNTENSAGQPSLTDLFLNLRSGVQNASGELESAQSDLEKVNPDNLPPEIKGDFLEIRQKLPLANASLKNFLDYSQIFLDILGYNGPRKYLFLFENNQEMRATGGFIGSYGILDISNGRVKKLFVDDIYNPDGQLKARIVPPEPIQKMSAVWTMHDANWFPDFPVSAEKVSWFYEKTGGPTVDGVIAVTPELLCDLLEITGPIEMPEYDTTVDARNFIEKTQYEVEIDYDRELNRPKKFVADLTPKILDRVFTERGLVPMMRTLKAFNVALSEKHLLLYSRNYGIQKLISDQKWSGEILQTDKDYLSVVNTNINGFKTDGVIDESIGHKSEIHHDGSIVDTVSVTRKHRGGNEEYDWWNKVNGDWIRVYVPRDAKLLEVSGQTREFIPPALDYASLGFKRDPQIEAADGSARVDEESGTKIYEENSKTVFANWVYVSPGEETTITYKYVLPFRLSFDALHHPADSFSVLYQKQSGSVGSKLVSEIRLPDNLKTIWRWPDDLRQSGDSYKMETVLTTDKFVGMAVERK